MLISKDKYLDLKIELATANIEIEYLKSKIRILNHIIERLNTKKESVENGSQI